jgi:hypothetical protein
LFNRRDWAACQKGVTPQGILQSKRRMASYQKSERMKRFGWIFVLLIAASPALAAKSITVQQLKDLLVADQQAKKADADVAADSPHSLYLRIQELPGGRLAAISPHSAAVDPSTARTLT